MSTRKHGINVQYLYDKQMKAKANTTSEQSNKKSLEVGDPRMAEMEE